MNEIDELIETFRLEAAEFLDELTRVLDVQRFTLGDARAFMTASRIAHNLKGAALTVGAHRLADSSHALETELEATATQGKLPNRHQVETWLREVAVMSSRLGDAELVDCAFLANTLRASGVRNGATPNVAPSTASTNEPSLITVCVETRHIDTVATQARNASEILVQMTERTQTLHRLFNEASCPPTKEDSGSQFRQDFGNLLLQLRQDLRELERIVLNDDLCQNRTSPQSLSAEARESEPKMLVTNDTARQRILVVDDSLIVRTVEEQILVDANYEVSVCANGEEALALLEQQRYALVVCDVQMPNMDGFELTARIRETSKLRHLPIILVTSRSAPEDITRGTQVGANGYITKSELNQENLLLGVRRLLE